MAHVASGSVVRQIGSLFEGGSVSGLSDRQLLERFVSRRDAAGEAAFAALVARHGPMVLLVCRRLLGDYQHAEDTFQAVFLVLARRARSVRDPDLLSHWLYGVALRAARKARVRLVRQRKNERDKAISGADPESGVPADRSAIDREHAELLHHEIERLPRDFRMPIVLCYFEGLALDEAARRLHWREGTLRSRLARARDKLRRGLTRRGMVLPAVAIASVLDSRPVSAALSSPLCGATTRAAVDFAAKTAAAGTVSAAAMALAHEVLRSMLLHRLKFTVLTLLFLGTIASGAVFVSQAPARQTGKPDLRQTAAKPSDVNPKPGPGRMFVVGRVLDPVGKPVPGASVMVYARSIMTFNKEILVAGRSDLKEMGRAAGDGSGHFRAEVSRTSSSRNDAFGAVAVAPGYGAGWVELDPDADADSPAADITLRPEQVVHGRLFDLQGQPVRDVKLSVMAIQRVRHDGPGPREERLDGPTFWWTHPDNFAGWPSPAISDADGRFTVHGVGPALRALLTVRDPRFVSQIIEINTDATSTTVPLRFVLQPARTVTGRVTYADTGKPVPHAEVWVVGFHEQTGVAIPPIATVADAEGRFRANAGSGDNGVVAAGTADGQPYLIEMQSLEWPKGAVTHSVDLALSRGLMMRGKVTEHGSGRPVSGAIVAYTARRAPEDGADIRKKIRPVETMADGSFALSIVPRSGYLTVQAPTDDYVLQPQSNELRSVGLPLNVNHYAHAFVACEPKPGTENQDVKIALQPGVTVKGQVVGPDGQPVRDALMVSRIHLGPSRMWSAGDHRVARNGRFELHGLDLDSAVSVSFFEPNRKLGATVPFSGKLASGELIVVKLEPCATATARLVGPGRKPLAGYQNPALISMVVTQGEFSLIKARRDGTAFADQGILTVVDPINYAKAPAADGQGRIVFPALIPGATYRIIDRTTGPQLRKEFTVKPGEALDLGEVRIGK